MPSPLDDLLAISHTVGRDATLIQAGGGNTSVKTGDGRMLVKASGTPLGEMSAGKGYRRVRLDGLLAMLRDDELMTLPAARRETLVKERMLAACDDELEGRPSVESPLHAFLPRCVAHVHSVAVNGLLCAREGRTAILDLYADPAAPPLYLPYCDPGLPLARETFAAGEAYRAEYGSLPRRIFLENHGLFVSAETADEAIELARATEAAARVAWQQRVGTFKPPRVDIAAIRDNVIRVRNVMVGLWRPFFGAPPRLRHCCNGPAMAVAARDDAVDLLAAGCLTPDHVVYAHGAPLWLDDTADEAAIERALAEQLTAVLKRQAAPPRTVLARNVGLFVIDPSSAYLAMTESTVAAALESLLIAAAFGGPRGLSPAAADYIENWEVERFRRSVAQSNSTATRDAARRNAKSSDR